MDNVGIIGGWMATVDGFVIRHLGDANTLQIIIEKWETVMEIHQR
jgi:hypothetical protein